MRRVADGEPREREGVGMRDAVKILKKSMKKVSVLLLLAGRTKLICGR
jgi:hypothetical protein